MSSTDPEQWARLYEDCEGDEKLLTTDSPNIVLREYDDGSVGILIWTGSEWLTMFDVATAVNSAAKRHKVTVDWYYREWVCGRA